MLPGSEGGSTVRLVFRCPAIRANYLDQVPVEFSNQIEQQSLVK